MILIKSFSPDYERFLILILVIRIWRTDRGDVGSNLIERNFPLEFDECNIIVVGWRVVLRMWEDTLSPHPNSPEGIAVVEAIVFSKNDDGQIS